MQSPALANGTIGQTEWSSINWKKTNRIVRNLRQRIFKAARAGEMTKVRQLQKLILRCYSNTLISVRRVTQVNAGSKTAGVDNVIVKTPKARMNMAEEIQRYQPWSIKPTRRIYIPKANGKQRPLGIPTIIDRAHQARIKNALEPEWEAKFEGISYGFRPGRGCHDAILGIYAFARSGQRKKWVVDADIKGAFDNISHEFLMQAIEQFPARELIKQWLKAGYMDKGVFHDTASGTPQGGVISPLLANIALHGMESTLGIKRNYRGVIKDSERGIIRYADDFVVFCESKEDAEQVIKELASWLIVRGLALSEEKTRIVHVSEGFDFLGFNIRQYNLSNGSTKLLVKPSRKSIQAIKNRLKAEWKRLNGHNALEVVKRLNPIITGWANYFRKGNATKALQHLEHFQYERSYKWAKWQHPKKSRGFIRKKYWGRFHKNRNDNWVFGDIETGIYLRKFNWFPVERHVKVKGTSSKDDPSLRLYWLQREKAKSRDLPGHKQRMALNQAFRCPVCGDSLFNEENLQDHHIITDKANPHRHFLKNRRLVHYYCHQQIHLLYYKHRHSEWGSQIPKLLYDLLEPYAGKTRTYGSEGGRD